MRSTCVALLVVLSSCGGDDYAFTDHVGDNCDIGYDRIDYLRRPTDLYCDPTFVGPHCSSGCSSCPTDEEIDAARPAWAECTGRCADKSQTECAADPSCRVTFEASVYFHHENPSQANHELYLGCYEVGVTPPPPDVECAELDAESCRSSTACTGVFDAPDGITCGDPHRTGACNSARFVSCIPRDLAQAGMCEDQTTPVACDEAAPACPEYTVPGVANGCYTRACIPGEYCTPRR